MLSNVLLRTHLYFTLTLTKRLDRDEVPCGCDKNPITQEDQT